MLFGSRPPAGLALRAAAAVATLLVGLAPALAEIASAPVALVEPAMILIFGTLVGFVALAMLQAIYGINLNAF